MKTGIILGSVRENRRAELVGKWILSQADDSFSIVDLKEFHLPHYNEPGSPSSGMNYIHETTKNWSNEIRKYDSFIFVTPEYNGMITGALKDAIDYLYFEWKDKPFGIVGYGGRGAKWASEGLEKLLKRFDMKYEGFVGIHKPWDSLSLNGEVHPDYIEGNIQELLDKLN